MKEIKRVPVFLKHGVYVCVFVSVFLCVTLCYLCLLWAVLPEINL